MIDEEKLDEMYTALGMAPHRIKLGRARRHALVALLQRFDTAATLGALTDEQFVEECLRGTGRTTHMIFQAILKAESGVVVFIGVENDPAESKRMERCVGDYTRGLRKAGLVNIPRREAEVLVVRLDDDGQSRGFRIDFFDHHVPEKWRQMYGR